MTGIDQHRRLLRIHLFVPWNGCTWEREWVPAGKPASIGQISISKQSTTNEVKPFVHWALSEPSVFSIRNNVSLRIHTSQTTGKHLRHVFPDRMYRVRVTDIRTGVDAHTPNSAPTPKHPTYSDLVQLTVIP